MKTISLSSYYIVRASMITCDVYAKSSNQFILKMLLIIENFKASGTEMISQSSSCMNAYIKKMVDFILALNIKFSSFPGWKVRCSEYFPYSTYFEGNCSSAMPNSVYNQIGKNHENGSASLPGGGKLVDSIASNGKLEEAFKEITI